MKATKISPDFEPVVAHLQMALRGIRTSRASTALVESITVDAYGTPTRLRDMASLTIPDPRTIQIEPWDAATLGAIEKALSASSLGVTPSVTGKVIRLNLPPLTEERRRELLKLVGKYTEEARIAIRHTREKLLRELRKRHESKELSDTAHDHEKQELQKRVDDVLRLVQEIKAEKEAELLSGT